MFAVGGDGSFSVPFNLTLTRLVTVNYKGVNLVVAIKGGSAWKVAPSAG